MLRLPMGWRQAWDWKDAWADKELWQGELPLGGEDLSSLEPLQSLGITPEELTLW